MASIVALAEYILERQGPMSSMKLQKLCYYSQAWHLAWDGEPMFPNEIHAWANGPVIPDLYELHKGTFTLYPGMVELAAEAKAARVKVKRDLARGEDGMWTWAVPNLIWGGPDVTGVGSSPRQCADDGRAALRRLYELGMEMLKVKPWNPPEDDDSRSDSSEEDADAGLAA